MLRERGHPRGQRTGASVARRRGRSAPRLCDEQLVGLPYSFSARRDERTGSAWIQAIARLLQTASLRLADLRGHRTGIEYVDVDGRPHVADAVLERVQLHHQSFDQHPLPGEAGRPTRDRLRPSYPRPPRHRLAPRSRPARRGRPRPRPDHTACPAHDQQPTTSSIHRLPLAAWRCLAPHPRPATPQQPFAARGLASPNTRARRTRRKTSGASPDRIRGRSTPREQPIHLATKNARLNALYQHWSIVPPGKRSAFLVVETAVRFVDDGTANS
jgi:hypothetical protein